MGRNAAQETDTEEGGRRGFLLARRRSLAHRELLRRRLRLRGHVAGGVPRGPQDLRRIDLDHARVLRLRHLLLAAPRGLVRALQVLQAIRDQRLLHYAPERCPAVHRAFLRVPLEVPLRPNRGPVARLRLRCWLLDEHPRRGDRAWAASAPAGDLRSGLRRRPARVRPAVPASLRPARHARAQRVREVEDTRGDTGLLADDRGRGDLHRYRRPRRGSRGLLGGVQLSAALPCAADQQLPHALAQKEKTVTLLISPTPR